MIDRLKQSWAGLTPNGKKLVAVVGAFTVLMMVIAVTQQEPEKRERPYDKKTHQIRNVLTDRSSRNASLDSMSGRLSDMTRQNDLLERQVKALEQRLKSEADKQAEQSKRLYDEIRALNDKIGNMSVAPAGVGPDGKPTVETVEPNPFAEQEMVPADQKGRTSANKPVVKTIRVFTKDGEVSAANKKRIKEEKKAEKKKKEADAYIPAGSILTGTIITGGDFPTSKNGMDNPTPLLLRITKESILPNRYRTDIRECFMLMGGRGELSSERVKLRGEMLSCIRHDGSVIETKLDSYVAGEDGKEGVKGRLVSKQGQMIARSMVAGFASGLSEAFDVDAVPTINTSSDGTVSYEKAYSSDALQGAAIKGFSNTLERISEFYLDMANEIFPVVEVNAGRQVDVVVIRGTSLKVSAEGVFAQEATSRSSRR